MARTKEDRLIYGRVSAVVTEGILEDAVIKYLLGKKKIWTEEFGWLVDWAAMGAYMGSLGSIRLPMLSNFHMLASMMGNTYVHFMLQVKREQALHGAVQWRLIIILSHDRLPRPSTCLRNG